MKTISVFWLLLLWSACSTAMIIQDNADLNDLEENSRQYNYELDKESLDIAGVIDLLFTNANPSSSMADVDEVVDSLEITSKYQQDNVDSMYWELYRKAFLHLLTYGLSWVKIWMVLEYFNMLGELQSLILYYLTSEGTLVVFCALHNGLQMSIHNDNESIIQAFQQNPVVLFFNEATQSFNELISLTPQIAENLPSQQIIEEPQPQQTTPPNIFIPNKQVMFFFLVMLIIAAATSWLSG